jgi:hypothetical protein
MVKLTKIDFDPIAALPAYGCTQSIYTLQQIT